MIWTQQLFCLSTTLLIAVFLTIQCRQTSTHWPKLIYIRYFVHNDCWTVTRMDRWSTSFFQTNYLQDGRVNKTGSTVQELSGCWKPEQLDWVPPFVALCDSIRVWPIFWFVSFLSSTWVFSKFFNLYLFRFFPFRNFRKKKTSSTTFMWSNTPKNLKFLYILFNTLGKITLP